MCYFRLYADFLEQVEELTMEERGRLITAITGYLAAGEAPAGTLTGAERVLFPTFRRQVDRDRQAYEARVRQNRLNGIKGGRPAKAGGDETAPAETEKNPMGYLGTEKTQYKDKDEYKDEYENENKDEDENEDTRAHAHAREPAPTLDEVLDYCRENRLATNGWAFWNHYQANGWQAGGQSVRDWRAKLREWNARDTSGDRPARASPATVSAPGSSNVPAPNPALNYQQRTYREEDFGDDFFTDLDAYGEGAGAVSKQHCDGKTDL